MSLRSLLVPALAVAIGGLAVLGAGGANAQSRTLNVQAGGGADGNWVNLFLPGDVTIATGDTISWSIESGEPHSITFVLGQPPDGDALPVTPSPVNIPDDGPVINSDLIFGGNPENPPTFEATFTAAGTYDYFCIIHPFMTGSVEVLDPGDAGSAGIDNQLSIDARGQAALNSGMIEGAQNDAAIKARIPAVVPKAGGAREYGVILGGATQNTQQNIMYPATLQIRPGDSVRFINETPIPHTATFGGVPQGDPFAAPATTNTDPGAGPVNTGIIEATVGQSGPPQPSSRVLTFSKAGTYSYLCIIHPEMVGQVVVSASAPLPPNTGTGARAESGNGTEGLYLVLGAVALAMLATGAAFAASRRA